MIYFIYRILYILRHYYNGGTPVGFLYNIFPNQIGNNFNVAPLIADMHSIDHPNQLSIIIIEKGTGLALVNEQAISITTPTIIFLNESEKLHFSSVSHITGKIVSFHPSALREYFTLENVRTFDHSFSVEDIKYTLSLSIFFNRFKSYNGYISTSEPVLKHLAKLLDMIVAVQDQPAILSSRLCDFMAYLQTLVKTHSLLSHALIAETSFEVKDVLLYLHNNHKQKITIPQLSRHFHVNRTTLSNRFFEATGETIITYLNKHRINLSAILLRESTLSISDIADEVGFNDTAYFAKLFKKIMHHTPSGYRQRYYALTQVHTPHQETES